MLKHDPVIANISHPSYTRLSLLNNCVAAVVTNSAKSCTAAPTRTRKMHIQISSLQSRCSKPVGDSPGCLLQLLSYIQRQEHCLIHSYNHIKQSIAQLQIANIKYQASVLLYNRHTKAASGCNNASGRITEASKGRSPKAMSNASNTLQAAQQCDL
jgi:hypothetical protein